MITVETRAGMTRVIAGMVMETAVIKTMDTIECEFSHSVFF